MAETEIGTQEIEDGIPDSPVIPLLRPKVRKACSECRRSKSKCDQAEWPCKRCQQRGLECDLRQTDKGQTSTHLESSARSLASPPCRPTAITNIPSGPPYLTLQQVSTSTASSSYSPVSPYAQEHAHHFGTRTTQHMGDATISPIYHNGHAMEYSLVPNDHYPMEPMPARHTTSSAAIAQSPQTAVLPQQPGPVSHGTGGYRLQPSAPELFRLDEDCSKYSEAHQLMQTGSVPLQTYSGRYMGVSYGAQEEHQSASGSSGLYYAAQAHGSGEYWTQSFANASDAPTRTPYNQTTYASYFHGQSSPTSPTSTDGWSRTPTRELHSFRQEQRSAPHPGSYPAQANHRFIENTCQYS